MLAILGLFAILLLVLGVDGRLFERWKSAMVLRNLHRSWERDGAPQPFPDPSKYGYASWGTSYVDSASYVIKGGVYHGLYGFRDYTRPDHLTITTNGVLIVFGKSGTPRLLWMAKKGAGAW